MLLNPQNVAKAMVGHSCDYGIYTTRLCLEGRLTLCPLLTEEVGCHIIRHLMERVTWQESVSEFYKLRLTASNKLVFSDLTTRRKGVLPQPE